MGALTSILLIGGTFLLTFLGSIIAALLRDEAKAWLPHLTTFFVERAVRRLPFVYQSRYKEEWLSVLAYVPGPLSKLFQAILLLWNAPKISAELLPPKNVEAEQTPLVERFAGVAALVFLAPSLLLVALIVSMDGGPVLVRTVKELKQGDKVLRSARFVFRTWSWLPGRFGRVTFFGNFLHRSSVSDLPMLLNVVAGTARLPLTYRAAVYLAGGERELKAVVGGVSFVLLCIALFMVIAA